MSDSAISPLDPFERQTRAVLDSEMAYIDTGGNGSPVVFLHGNPTSSYLWRNVIPHVVDAGRCLAPDLIGMGRSGKAPDGDYSFTSHVRYLDAWFEALGLTDDVTLVIHDWGSALGFYRAQRFAEQIRAIVYMEAIVQPVTWADWPEAAVGIFQGFRSERGESLILERNFFVERILPGSILRDLTDEEMAAYRAPYLEKGESRRPMLTWPRQIPIEGEPADVVAIVEGYGQFMRTSPIPKLFVNADPGSILTGPQREFCRQWANQQEVTVRGSHFVQEDSPHEIGRAITTFLDGLNEHGD